MSWKELAFKDEVATLSDTAPVDVTKAAAVAGTGTAASRDDHKHDITTGTPGTIGESDTAAEGTATTIARSDHIHGSPASWTPAVHATSHKLGGGDEVDLDELGLPTGVIDLNQQQADGLVLETGTTGPDAASEVAGQIYYNSTDKAAYIWVSA